MKRDPRRSQRERLKRSQSRDTHADDDAASGSPPDTALTSPIRRSSQYEERHFPDATVGEPMRRPATADAQVSRPDPEPATAASASPQERGFLGLGRPTSSLHRAVDALRQSPMVEMHRSSSGRNLRLKHVAPAEDGVIVPPNALMPRAPSGRRPEALQSTRSSDGSNNSRSSSDSRERRSSFSISAHALKELERSRSSTTSPRLRETREEPEQHEEEEQDQQREHQSEDSYEDDWEAYDEEDDAKDNNHEPDTAATQHDHAEEEMEEKPVACFGLWGNAPKNKRLPNAIIFSGADTTDTEQPAHHHATAESVATPASSSTSGPSAREMVSQLQVAHPGLAALALDIPESLSLTRSTSPRIGRSTSAAMSRTSSQSPRVRATSISGEDGREVQSTHSKPITKWKRGELVGEGTFGKVYMGLNSVTGELFALKEIEIRESPNADQVTQMQKLGEEIALMNNLCHKHIVRYKGSHRTANHFYIFMEYVPGGSIASMLKQFDAFSEDLIRIFTRQIVQGVVYLHRMGIIHRDIKGANVLVNEQGMSKLADFGCSKQIPQMLTTSLEESLRAIRGSIPWMAPEVVKQTGHGYKADVWSIGATVVEMATAQHPWPECRNGLSAMYAIAMATSAPPLPEHLSGEAKAFLRRCFCVNPEERATAVELADHAFLAPTS